MAEKLYRIHLSEPSKLRGVSLAYSLNNSTCGRGGELRACPGSICSLCYASRGRARLPKNEALLDINQCNLPTSRTWRAWAIQAAGVIQYETERRRLRHFRWFSSGDLQSLSHYRGIIRVAELLPTVKFWLPTREIDIIRRGPAADKLPANLCVRVSADWIDGAAPEWWPWVSTVYRDRVGFSCPASGAGSRASCQSCRACWVRGVSSINYQLH